MMGSLFSSISGLKNHTTWMNTIGNNISNVNTTGFKYQRVTFKEQITQSMGAASGANLSANIGGKNPQQMGLGAALGSIDTIMTQGAIQSTGNPLDVAIQGEGFFAVESGSANYYTRAGNFYQDNQGNVTTATGAIAQGWMGALERTAETIAGQNPEFQIREASYELRTQDVTQVGNIVIPNDLTMAAQMTGYIDFVGNLDSNTPLHDYATPDPVAAADETPLPSNYSPDQAPNAAGLAAPTLDEVRTASLPGGAAGTNYYFQQDAAVAGSPELVPDHTATMEVYDSLGSKRSITIQFYQHGADITAAGGNDFRPVWDWYAFDTTEEQAFYGNCIGGTNIDMDDSGTDATVYSPIWFNQDGSLASSGSVWEVGTAGPVKQDYMLDADGVEKYGPMLRFEQDSAAQGLMPDGAATPWEVLLNFGTPNTWDTTTGGTAADGVIHVNDDPAGNTAHEPGNAGLRDGLTGDVTGSYQTVGGVKQYVPNSTAYGKEQDGYGAGELLGLSVDTTGGIVGEFSNERSITIAKFAMAMFANKQGLSKAGDSLYSTTSNSGIARLTEAGKAGAGTLQGGALEASNVDLSQELTNMIIAQRGFESNARIITTSANMLDTLVNVGR